MLWLALEFPDLPLAALPSRPLPAVVAEHGCVLVGDEIAAAAGLTPGMRTATARGMLPELAVLARDAQRERQLLEELACWAAGFSPEICLLPPAALLLEIGGCLRLFGGMTVIVEGLRAGCRERGVALRCAAAPTPLAALWLAAGSDIGAAAGNGLQVTTLEALPEALAPLPLEIVAASAEIHRRLLSFGLRRLGDVLALPRAGLARRLGGDFVLELERALGERPDPRRRHVFAEKFSLRIELPGRVEAAPALAFAAQRLIEALCGWLATRQAGCAGCTLLLEHERHAATPLSRIELALSAPTREPGRFVRVLRERLERSSLAAPVEAVSLLADSCEILAGSTAELFTGAGERAGVEALVEILRARLGDDAVHGIAVVADHRPERATRAAAVGTAMLPGGTPPARPLWLLDPPESLDESDGRPQCRGRPLELLAGPERIESGWWDDDGDVRREYFVARSPAQEWLWIYRDGAGWHLHGMFA